MWRMAVIVVCGTFLIGAFAGHTLFRQDVISTRTFTNPHQLAAELEAHGLILHYVEDGTCNAYLSTSVKSLDQLLALKASPEYAHEWKGVVIFKRTCPALGMVTSDWGDFHWWASDYLVVYGDPELVQRIKKIRPNE